MGVDYCLIWQKIGSVPSPTLCVIFAFLAYFAVNCLDGFFTAKYAKNRKATQSDSPELGHYETVIGC